MGINAPQKREDAWDRIAKVMGIANQGIGIVGGIQGIRKSSNDMDIADAGQERIKTGTLTPKEQLEFSKDYTSSDTESPGSFGLKTPQGKDVFYSPKDKGANKATPLTQKEVADLRDKGFTDAPVGSKGATEYSAFGPDGAAQRIGLVPPARVDAATAAKDPKSDQFKVAQFGQRMQQSENVFKKLGEEGFDPTSYGTGAQRTEVLGIGIPNRLKSSQVQQQEQAERSFINAVLRRESGAAISNTEFASGEKQYFPRGGDSPEVLKQKAENRALAINGFKQESGGAWDRVGSGAAPTSMVAKKGGPSEVVPSAVAGDDGVHTRVVDGVPYKKTKGGWQAVK